MNFTLVTEAMRLPPVKEFGHIDGQSLFNDHSFLPALQLDDITALIDAPLDRTFALWVFQMDRAIRNLNTAILVMVDQEPDSASYADFEQLFATYEVRLSRVCSIRMVLMEYAKAFKINPSLHETQAETVMKILGIYRDNVDIIMECANEWLGDYEYYNENTGIATSAA